MLPLSELYDAMDFIQRLLLTSAKPTVRAECGQLLLRFLVHYPLGPKRLQGHMHHLLQNLDFAWESGRAAVLSCLRALAAKLPLPVLAQHTQLLLLPLTLRLVHEPAVACRKQAAGVIGLVLERTSKEAFTESMGFVTQWVGAPLPGKEVGQTERGKSDAQMPL